MKCKHKEKGRCKSCSNEDRKGNYNWSEEAKENRKNNGNPIWKGDNVKYDALHAWIRRNKEKPELCENCNKNKSYDLANISGDYKRDVNDFKWLCRKCHMNEDGRIKNLKQYQNG